MRNNKGSAGLTAASVSVFVLPSLFHSKMSFGELIIFFCFVSLSRLKRKVATSNF